jgi:hypothetical protein
MKRKSETISRHILCAGVAVGTLCVLTTLFSSCEKELAGEGSGKKIAVNISLYSSDFTDAPRSNNSQLSQAETVEVSLGRDDGVYMRATLAEIPVDDPDAGELRATTNLATNQRVRLAAFKTGTSTQEGSTTDYIYSGGKLNPAGVSGPLLVEENQSYEIVAYSYFNDVTNYPATTNINSANQLLWGMSAAKTVTQSNREVSITMAQKFAQVKVAISTANLAGTPNITAISGVTIASGGNRCNLTVYNGNLVTGTPPATQALTFSTLNASTITSTARRIYPVEAEQSTTLTIGSITINGTAYANLEAFFNKELLGGHSYTLTVDLRKSDVVFAGSNIYWDGTKMTFKPAGYVGKETFYQGLFFKWGSLVGISPAGPVTSTTVTASTKIYYPTSNTAWSANGATVATLYGSGSTYYSIIALNGSFTNDHSGDALTNRDPPFEYVLLDQK